MNISQKGLDLIKHFEGCILQSYDDYNDKIINKGENVRGTLTIGYGHVEGVYKGQTITQQEANEMLANDMVRYAKETQDVLDSINVPFEVTQNVFDALVSFEYNNGKGGLRTLLADGERDKQTVADMMLEYRNRGSVWEQGLLRRRQAERELFLLDGSESITYSTNREYEEHGNATVLVNKLNVRTKPTLKAEIVATYREGETILNYDRVYEADGYRWIRYMGSSGNYRYVAVRELSTNKRYANCY